MFLSDLLTLMENPQNYRSYAKANILSYTCDWLNTLNQDYRSSHSLLGISGNKGDHPMGKQV